MDSVELLVGGLKCGSCKLFKPIDSFSPYYRRTTGQITCRDCKNESGRHNPSKAPEYQKSYHAKKRKLNIQKFQGEYEETIQTCHRCGFDGWSRHFCADKSKPSGHNNECLACKRDRTQKWKNENREAVRQSHRDYKRANRDKVSASARRYRASSPNVRILGSIRSSINQCLRGIKRGGRSLELLGVKNIEEYRCYLEKLFELGMSWENYGNGLDKWNIDHRKPLFTFDLTDPEQQRIAFHYSNTRPMWQSENGSNGAIARWRKKGAML